MIGRFNIIERLKNNYTKKSPSHLSVVGSRFSGKSVLLNALAENIRRDESSPFEVVVLWDLGHQTPINNEDFLRTMCKKIGSKLRSVNKEWGEILLASDDPYDDLREVIEQLASEKVNILMLWDGFDKPLSSGKLTRNLWDQLRALAQSSSLRLITASRKPLHKLIRDEDSVASDFWNIFDPNSVIVGVFDEDDKNTVLKKLNNIEFDKGSKKELINWTGGFPPLYLLVINQLLALTHVDNIAVEEAAKTVLGNSASGILEDLWKDCPASTKELFLHLVEKSEIPISETSSEERNGLIEKGFGKTSSNKIIKNCRLMEHHIRNQKEVIDSVARLFKEHDDYQKNIKPVLEHRLNQIKNIDNRLKELIERCIEDIPKNPEDCLKNMRGILDRALNFIVNKEFPEQHKIPSDWIAEWQYDGRKIDANETFPNTTNKKLYLIQSMTGAYPGQKTPPKAKYANKASYCFLDNIKSYGDYGHHSDGQIILVETAVTAIMTCIELAASLDVTNKTEGTV
jgi:hypothetical protein